MADPVNPALEGEEVAMGGALGRIADVIQRVAPEIAEHAQDAVERAGLGSEAGEGVQRLPQETLDAVREGANAIFEARAEREGAGNPFNAFQEKAHEALERVEALIDPPADQQVIEAEAPQVMEAAPAEGAEAVPAQTEAVEEDAAYDASEA